MGMSRLAAVTVPLLLLAACGDDTTAPPTGEPAQTLDGRTFVGDEVSGHDLVKGSTLRLSFQDGRLEAQAGCNHLSGTGRLDGGVLVGRIDVTTDMGCDRPLMDQDTWLSAFLGSRPEATVSAEALVLAKDGTTITLNDQEHVRAMDPIPLEGTTWALESLIAGSGDEGAVSSVPGEHAPTLVIEGGRIRVFTGCNRGSGRVEVDDASLTISALAVTKTACEDGATAEQAVLAVLEGEVGYVQDYDVLTLTSADGTSGLQYRAVS